MNVGRSFQDYRPRKSSLAWTAVGASVLTMVLGFTAGGWVTGGTAERMAVTASTEARVELASRVCAANFLTASDARAQHDELTALSSYRQRGYMQLQPWALMPGESSVDQKVADLCARTIMAMEPHNFPPVEEAGLVLEPEADPG